ncbi:CpaD family pilus assembly protein [Rhizobium alvei]|uniref:CpaD family pilus assembly lipoprotein n=1 Tax=Rhizobium alvei TaxID=1132659 RepID=A0ABT8YRG5_9HYPH|nr:CpaD family pilus assembly lipoprotein [Rhizobium alvei]MDO6966212.1 CpaD family pilus assembly lipoprotein [Rhizobium alvei]
MDTNRMNISPLCRSRNSRFASIAAIAVMSMAALTLASCGTVRPDRQTTASIPDDYRTRHPITLAEVEHNLDVPIAAGDMSLTPATRDLIRGFAQDYSSLSSGTIQVLVPQNAANSGATYRVRKDIQGILQKAGIQASRIVQSSYAPRNSEASSPIQLRFVAVTAVTDDCGQWPSDLVGPTAVENKNWENFGCATQQNLAAQIANPADLVGPRGMTPIDAQRRATVISVYREDGGA